MFLEDVESGTPCIVSLRLRLNSDASTSLFSRPSSRIYLRHFKCRLPQKLQFNSYTYYRNLIFESCLNAAANVPPNIVCVLISPGKLCSRMYARSHPFTAKYTS